ncbi:hypothetical protein [uncultured Draconibacterium sp.]|uniref:hypothetical protein n=1 Tax=uncultured Draconibacterium sp. TaxID=1573823 RepID=UPI0025CE7B8D|nr:hypothetical protein [uncultured Draconibacterium sp.]
MKKKVNKNRFPDLDKFDRKQKNHGSSWQKGSKQKPSIYDAFDEEDEDESYLSYSDEEEE